MDVQGPNRLLSALELALYAAAIAGIWASHAAGLTAQVPAALLVGAAIGVRGMRRGSLSSSGWQLTHLPAGMLIICWLWQDQIWKKTQQMLAGFHLTPERQHLPATIISMCLQARWLLWWWALRPWGPACGAAPRCSPSFWLPPC